MPSQSEVYYTQRLLIISYVRNCVVHLTSPLQSFLHSDIALCKDVAEGSSSVFPTVYYIQT